LVCAHVRELLRFQSGLEKMNFRVVEADSAFSGQEGEPAPSAQIRTGTFKNRTTSAVNARFSSMYNEFAEQGYVGPFYLLSSQECRRFLRTVAGALTPPPLDWEKGYAAISRAFYRIASYPALIEKVAALLGEDVMLWGASIQTRGPGAVHPWHSDIESSSAPPGKTLSVWIGLRGTSPDSSLLLVPYSHRFGTTVQQVRSQSGVRRDETTNEDIVRWAKARNERSLLFRPEISDGEAIIFDGQLWHGSHNVSRKTRRALLLQYATPDTRIRIPDLNYLDWPFHHLESPKPPCIMVRGSAKSGANRIVPPPVAPAGESSRQLTGRIYQLRLPLAPDSENGWKPYSILSGSTADMWRLSCHASALAQGHCPHPPHTHDEEEILLVLAGEVDLILPTAQTADGKERRRLRPGQFVYYPAHFAHTLETVSEDEANYVMFKWHSGKTESASPLVFGQFNFSGHLAEASAENGFRTRLVFEGPTAYLRKLHCHISTLSPQAGYEPHVDAYDVAIIVLEGEVETLGDRVGSHGVIFYPAGEPHGMYNPGKSTAKYIVFEFHGSQRKLGDEDSLSRPPSLFAKLRDPQRVKRKLKQLFKQYMSV
jgi:quercetin dioxygenase-like cupin family protein